MIRVLHKSATILDVIAELGASPHAQIARRTGLNKATLSNILKTLVEIGYVQKTAQGAFRLGEALRRLARKRAWDDTLPALADSWATALSERTGETVSVATIRNCQRIRLAKASVAQSISVDAGADAMTDASGYPTSGPGLPPFPGRAGRAGRSAGARGEWAGLCRHRRRSAGLSLHRTAPTGCRQGASRRRSADGRPTGDVPPLEPETGRAKPARLNELWPLDTESLAAPTAGPVRRSVRSRPFA